jgi:hypothetical protein
MCFPREYVTLSDFGKKSQVTYTCSLRIWGTLILVEYFSSLLGTNMCDRHRLWGWLGPWSPLLDIRTIPSTRAVPRRLAPRGGMDLKAKLEALCLAKTRSSERRRDARRSGLRLGDNGWRERCYWDKISDDNSPTI